MASVNIKLRKEGSLSKFGYKASDSTESRHRALRKAVRASSPVEVVRRLNAVAVLNKNRKPRMAAKFRADMRWIQENLYPVSKRSPKKSPKTVKRKSPKKSPKTVIARRAYVRADGTRVKSVRVPVNSPAGRKVLARRSKNRR